MKIMRGYGVYLFSISLLWAFWLQLSAGPRGSSTLKEESPWFLTAELALRSSDYTILDTRSSVQRWKHKIPGSKVISWEELSRTDVPHKGELLELKFVRKKINDLGIKENQYILVLGDGASGWGEEGRIVWSLREAGFYNSYWLEGGYSAFEKELQKKSNIQERNESNFDKANYKRISSAITKEEILKGLSTKQFQFLDTREPREFSGATPYGESRGGHIPGAKSLFYQELFDSKGNIRSKSEVELYLKQIGIQKNKPIVAYCTGGVRSAFVVGILRTYGYNAYNYAGSMWEWSHDPKLPLETNH
ncbi:rhodanese-like domain-containing protein [Leptospira sp. 2 VSF19]|uniref:Rhodanese-like domain-containing protein n=1 Tax=Leptospira soteropolitanensis TaxID=2950025 RepID=A0AAW5VDI7_9LEPT|nr:rhodanese-like domain-containing protein [Leptospira soteropolitanensis]MCW7493334.1 rhodanese-like domain-containing protein [Leptospira soteropolitanensis]MCW7501134.1 rhodanese-like domain-containing protein [Leptospira soteropolitanensis]MCW7523186.1 rhodanese-like domain-containing protein [Leptospira soteropolitanensis]MCW7527047.1 rhodanese-like domain-containing protein [Leptospira soteropolitanensis]MCW7530904.1 rhodanese-like domain-containing protein [Leptospira soteropolitanensi